MEANELKKGNIVYNGYEGGNEKLSAYQIAQIELMNNGGDVAEYYRALEYIPLTEDWLLKLGFKKDHHFYNIDSNFVDEELRCYFDDDGLYIEDIASVPYVHRLQNLYFALTGNELKIKP